MTAALASGPSGIASSEQVTPGTYVSTSLTDDHILSPDAGQPLDSEAIADSNSCKDASKVLDFPLVIIFANCILLALNPMNVLFMDRRQIPSGLVWLPPNHLLLRAVVNLISLFPKLKQEIHHRTRWR